MLRGTDAGIGRGCEDGGGGGDSGASSRTTVALPSSEVDSRIDEERFSSRGGWCGVVGGFVRRGLTDRGGGAGVDESTSCRRWCADVVISGCCSGRS